jgi:competence protein ComEC
MRLIAFTIAWMLGILLADLMVLPNTPLISIVVLSVLGALLCRRMPRISVALLVMMCGALGALRYNSAQVVTTPDSVWQFNDRGEVALQGVVIEDSRRSVEGQRLLIASERIKIGQHSQSVRGLVQVELPPYPVRRYGDRLELFGKLRTPAEAERPGLFDYRQYLARKQIFSLMTPNATRHIASDQASPFWAGLLRLRDYAQSVLLRVVPEPQAALANGILLGLQSSIPDDVNAAFSITGTSHVLVLSGWNITIISTMLYALTDKLKIEKRRAFWPILICIWLYTLFVGAATTVTRAAIMGTLVVVGQRLERPAHAWTTLFVACATMTLWNPQTLWDLGFQLSAMATASLFAYGKPVEEWLLRTPLRWRGLGWAREALTATLSAQILALPLILYHFGNLSIIAPLSNVLLLPAVPYAMLFGAIAMVAGMIWLPLGQWLGALAYLFLAWMTEGALLFAQLPYAAVLLPPFPLWLLLGYYAIVVGCWLWNASLDTPLPSKSPQHHANLIQDHA